jgi:hypothetical protein
MKYNKVGLHVKHLLSIKVTSATFIHVHKQTEYLCAANGHVYHKHLVKFILHHNIKRSVSKSLVPRFISLAIFNDVTYDIDTPIEFSLSYTYWQHMIQQITRIEETVTNEIQ